MKSVNLGSLNLVTPPSNLQRHVPKLFQGYSIYLFLNHFFGVFLWSIVFEAVAVVMTCHRRNLRKSRYMFFEVQEKEFLGAIIVCCFLLCHANSIISLSNIIGIFIWKKFVAKRFFSFSIVATVFVVPRLELQNNFYKFMNKFLYFFLKKTWGPEFWTLWAKITASKHPTFLNLSFSSSTSFHF